MTLDENDFLTFQLYTASKTPRINRRRMRSWILSTVAFLCLSYLFFESENRPLGFYFLALAGLTVIFYPLYSRWQYRRHYLKFIRDTYKNRFGEKCELEIAEDTIGTRDKTGEIKINKTEIVEINEIEDYYLIKASTGFTIIVAKKKSEIDKVSALVSSLRESGVKHHVELDWKWR